MPLSASRLARSAFPFAESSVTTSATLRSARPDSQRGCYCRYCRCQKPSENGCRKPPQTLCRLPSRNRKPNSRGRVFVPVCGHPSAEHHQKILRSAAVVRVVPTTATSPRLRARGLRRSRRFNFCIATPVRGKGGIFYVDFRNQLSCLSMCDIS